MVHENTPAKRLSKKGCDWVIETPESKVTAKKLLIVTNAYYGHIDDCTEPQTSKLNYFQMATKPLSEQQLSTLLPNREGCWDTALVLSPFRLDKAGGFIIGGIGSLDHSVSQTHCSWAARKLRQLFPELAEQQFEHSWFGEIAVTSDHIPKIVKLDDTALSIYGYSLNLNSHRQLT